MPIQLYPLLPDRSADKPAAQLCRHPELESEVRRRAETAPDGRLILSLAHAADLTVFCTETLQKRYGDPAFYDCSGGVCRPLDPADPDGLALTDAARQLTALLWSGAERFLVRIGD